MWLVAELAVSPFAHALQRTLFATDRRSDELRDGARRLEPRLLSGLRIVAGASPRSSAATARCAARSARRAWELTTYACIYCEESGETFVTAAPDEERKDRRIEVCSGCGGYLKTIDLPELSPFPLLSISDIETMDLDVAAMEHGYQRPALKEFTQRR